MPSFSRRNPVPSPPTNTFNDRILKFWEWFQEVAPYFHETIEAGECYSLEPQTSEKMDELFPGFGWVYGPGKEGIGHSLTLTGGGVEHRQFLALHWLSQAPSIEGWSFYAARQAGPIKGHVIKIHGHRIDPKEIWVTPWIDENEECLDLTIWHPLWSEIEERHQWEIVFLFLDEALGEYGTGQWVGEIRLKNDRLADSFPLEEFPNFVDDIVKKEGWKKRLPGEGGFMYEHTPSEIDYPRNDLITSWSTAPCLSRDYREAEGKLGDPLGGTGADYLYLALPREFFPKEQEVFKRGEIEDLIGSALQQEASGRCIGGGLGRERAYVDLLIFDGQRSLDIIVETLKHLNFPKGTTVEYFAMEKASHRILL